MRNTLLSLLLISLSLFLQAQPETCGPNPVMTSFCDDACIICDLDGFQGTSNSATNGVAPPGFCTIIQHNVGWIGFIATSEDLTLDIYVENCFGGGGLEVAIYESLDCESFNLVSNCLGAATHIPNNTTGTIFNTQPLVIGQYYYFVMDGNGGAVCDFQVTVALGSTEVKPPQAINEIFGETSLCTNGTFEYSIDTITGSPIVLWTIDGDEVGEGNPVNIQFQEVGVFELCVEASNICTDSSVVQCILVEVSDLATIDQFEIFCPSECIELNNETYCDEGNYEVVFLSFNGCDSIVFLEITHLEESFTEIIDTICSGQDLEVGNEIFDQTGEYEVILENSIGCDSIISIDLNVSPILVELAFEKICQGEIFEAGGEEFTSQGVYFIEESNNEGCDSIFELHLDVEALIPTFLFEEICLGDSIMIGDEVFNESGEYQIFLESQGNCDSLVELNLEVLSNSLTELNQQICSGDSVVIGNEVFKESGEYIVLFESNGEDCDSAVSLDLHVFENISVVLNESICQGDSVQFQGIFLSDSGTYEANLETQAGCDSNVVLELHIIPEFDTHISANICLGDSIEFNGNYYSETGIIEAVLESDLGCDSLIVLSLNVAETITTELQIEICPGDSIEISGQEFKEEGDYEIALESQGGCDSIVELSLSHSETTSITLDEKICASDSVQIGNEYFSESGSFLITLQGANTCDSVVNLNLEVLEDEYSLIQQEICEGDSVSIAGVVFFEEGDFQLVLENECGCDSILQIEIFSNPTDTSLLEIEICEGDLYTIGNEIFDQAGHYEVLLSNNAACDSLIILDLITKSCELQVEFEDFMLLCHGDANGILIIDVVAGTPEINYEWIHVDMEIPGSDGSISDLSEDIILSNLVAGMYRIILTDQAGIIDTVFAEVLQPEELTGSLSTSQYGNYNISCSSMEDGLIEAIAQGGTEPYNYSWQSGEQESQIGMLESGLYELTVTDFNGCQITLTTFLTEPDPIQVDYLVTNSTCEFAFGTLEIIAVSGGSGSYQSSLNQGPLTDELLFENLEGGIYQVSIVDEFGCLAIVNFEIETSVPIVVDLGPDITLNPGEIYMVDPFFNIIPDSFIWTGEGLSCYDCLNPSWENTTSSLISLEIFDEFRCSAIDEMLITISSDRSVYAPNSFSPNSDGLNDIFTLYAPDYVHIEKLSVFSRWGELVFEAQNIPVSDAHFGWDGAFKSQPLSPGIFVWYAEVVFADGETQILAGDINLIR